MGHVISLQALSVNREDVVKVHHATCFSWAEAVLQAAAMSPGIMVF